MDLTDTYRMTSGYLFREYYSRNPAGRYFYDNRFSYLTEKKQFDCPAKILIELLYAEYQFRYQAQLRDGWRERTTNKASSKDTPGDQIDLQKTHCGDFSQICQTYVERERTLYLKERELPNLTLAKLYRSVRNDPGWYLGTYPVAECAAMGGCCGRDCGCCVKRLPNLPRKGISGHCSLACLCCERSNGCTLDNDRVTSMDQQYKKALESDNPSFLTRIAHAYFQPTNGNAKSTSTSPDNDSTAGGNNATEKENKPNFYVYGDLKEKTDVDFGVQRPSSICTGGDDQVNFQTKRKRHPEVKNAVRQIRQRLLPQKARVS